MNQLSFDFNGAFVRVVMLDGEPWFVAKDVADILGYSNPSKAIADHVDDDDKLNNETLSSLGQRGGWLINESGVYSLILRSNMPKAKSFKRWVTHEVLPEIRKTGAYTVDADQTAAIINAQIVDIGKRQLRGEDIPPSLLNYVSRLLSFLGALPTQSGRKEADPPWMTAIIRTAENLAPKVRYSRRDVYRMYTDNCKDCGVSPLSQRAFWQSLRAWRPFQDIRSAHERMITFWED